MDLTSAIKKILNKKYNEVSPRGLKVHEYLNEEIYIDPKKVISNFETRKFNFKYFTGEFFWYLYGNFSIKFISKFSKFWNNLTNEKRKINSNYGQIILNKQFLFAYNELIKDKYSRKALMNINQPKHQEHETKDFPCTLNALFYIRNNKLNMRVNMRSQDIFYGLQYDAPWYSFIQQNMYLLLKRKYKDLKLGTYIHKMDNVHYYERHFKLVKNIKKEKTSTYYTFELIKPIIDIIDNKIVLPLKLKKEFQYLKTENLNVNISSFYLYLLSLGYFNIKKVKLFDSNVLKLKQLIFNLFKK